MRTHRIGRTKRHHRRGAVVVVAAFSLAFVVALLAFAADWGYMVLTESELQNAADAGALSGARALPQGRAAAIAAAQMYAGANVAAGQSVGLVTEEDVEIGLWDDVTATFTVLPLQSAESPNAVRVTCRRIAARGTALNLFFAPIMGTQHAELAAMATAAIQRDRCGVITGRDFIDIRNGNLDSYDSALGSYAEQPPRQNAHICSDGPITLGPNGRVYGDALPGEGYTVNRPEQVTGRTTPRSTTIRWSPVDLTGVEDNMNHTLPNGQLRHGKLRLSGGQTLTLEPGTYYWPAGIEMSGTSTIVVTGPTRIVMGGDSQIAGNGIVNQTNLAANLRIDITGGSANFTGNSAFYADLYGPTAHLTIDGNAGFYGAAFGQSVTLGGNASDIHGDEALRREYDETVRSTLKQ